MQYTLVPAQSTSLTRRGPSLARTGLNNLLAGAMPRQALQHATSPSQQHATCKQATDKSRASADTQLTQWGVGNGAGCSWAYNAARDSRFSRLHSVTGHVYICYMLGGLQTKLGLHKTYTHDVL